MTDRTPAPKKRAWMASQEPRRSSTAHTPFTLGSFELLRSLACIGLQQHTPSGQLDHGRQHLPSFQRPRVSCHSGRMSSCLCSRADAQ